MNREELNALSAQLGFDRLFAFPPMRTPRKAIHALNASVADDARELMPNVKTVLFLIKTYRPYEADDHEATLSAYYPASHAAYKAAYQFAEELRKRGFQAVSNAQIAIKPFLEAVGAGTAGKNTLIALPGAGSRFHVQAVLTDAETETDEIIPPQEAVSCLNCSACVNACPVRAISQEGRVDISRCLRARGEGEVVSEEMRPLYQNRILGCEICQDVCPRNAGQEKTAMPREIREALDLRKLLQGDMGLLSEWIGRNYARRTRIRMKAAMVAGNLRKAECLKELEELSQSGSEGEKEYAQWAVRQIKERDK